MSISQLFPEEGPTLNLNFAGSKTLDPRITFSRTSTGTYMDDSGLIKVAPADAPRFDHRYVNGEIESLGLLVEEARTNIKIRSEELQFDFGRAQITTISENEIISPDGLQTADGIVPNATLTVHYLDKVFTSTSGITTSQNICCSAFFKKGVGRDVWLQIYEESGNAYHGVQFNFETETLTFRNSNEYITGGGVTTGYNVIKYPNGWYRLWVAGYPNTTTTGRRYRIRLTDSSGVLDFSGDAVSSYVYSWGVQVEIGAFPTSYIPTFGSTVARTADNVSMVGDNFSDWYNPNEGTVLARYAVPSFSFTNRTVFGISSSFANRINARMDNQNIITPYIVTNGALTSVYSLPIISGASNSTAYTFSGNSSQSSTNGTLAVGGTQQSVPLPTCDTFSIGSIRNAEILCSTISQLTYYPTRLTNTQLQTLTK